MAIKDYSSMPGKFTLSIIFFLILTTSVCSTDRFWSETERPFARGHWLSREEYLAKDDFDRIFYETDPPPEPVRNIAEFEQMQAVLIRYSFGIPYDLIAEMSENVTILTIVAGINQENTVRSLFLSNNVNLDNCEFLYAATDTYWTRDYGPWFIIDGENEFGVVNFPYNRPRPNDNDIPIAVANYYGINLFGMNVIHTGGNYMTDGLGISASSDLVIAENPDLTTAEINQMMLDYLGIEQYHLLPDPNNTYIDHIDCWGKFLAADKILLRSVPPSHSQYDEIESIVDFFAAQVSSYGTPFRIYRVYTPNNEPYTNSLILNDKVLVPVTGSDWDEEALLAYQLAMPGYEVMGFDGSWASTDALHCRTKGIADLGMLYIEHYPVHETVPANLDCILNARIEAYSGADLVTDSLLIYYNINHGNHQVSPLTRVNRDFFQGVIPGQAYQDTVFYYIYAADGSGRRVSHPRMGFSDPHYFVIGPPLPTVLAAEPDSIQVVMAGNTMHQESIELTNIGEETLSYTISIIDSSFAPLTSQLLSAPVINFLLPESAPVVIEIRNLQGETVRNYSLGQLPAGKHTQYWNGLNNHSLPCPAGLYTFTIIQGNYKKQGKIILLY